MYRLTRSNEEALTVLAAGGVIAYPTEAVYGIGCRADLESAVMRVRRLKARPLEQGLIVLTDRLERLQSWLSPLTDDQLERLTLSWPGAITWLLPARRACPTWLRGDSDRLAVRVPDHALCRQLCEGLGGALVSSSANPPGQRPARHPGELPTAWAGALDLVLDAPVGGRDQTSEIRDLLTGRRLR